MTRYLSNIIRTGGLALGILFTAALAQAGVNCGDQVSGFVQLQNDLVCSGPGLIVAGDNTTIDLNGFSISCTGAGGGYQGSCQNTTTAPVMPSVMGIASTGHSGVEVKGPGKVAGFGVGIRLVSGRELRVTNVTVGGPASPDVNTNTRLLSVGVLIGNTICPGTGDPTAFVSGNDISNHTMGIQLSNAFCVMINSNYIHDNNGVSGDSHGIDVIQSGKNQIVRNLIQENGVNKGAPNGGIDGGIMLLGAASAGNLVISNNASNNCGDGITARNGAHDNQVIWNIARFNSTSTLGGQCAALVAGGIFFDLTERNAGAGNVWDPNNTCKTQGPGIPGGVCGPNE